jgi:glycosyltransferase involved in cell wall biosynthesis
LKKVAIVAIASVSGESGGAERFYAGLQSALCNEGVDAQVVSIVPDESSFRAILGSYLECYDLDLSSFDGVVSTKAPAYLVRHPNHVCYLQHTMRSFYDMFEFEFPHPTREQEEQRDWIRQLDTAAMSDSKIRHIFVIGEEVKNRLWRFNGIQSEVLYQSTTLSGFRTGRFDYLFMPGRLHRWKRVDLVIEALACVKAPVRLLISGTGEDQARIKQLAIRDPRIRVLGRVSDEELLEFYSNALAIPFVSCREDFGLVAIEAFHSAKPVITCVDSGEPARLVARFDAGLICEPTPKGLAAAIELLVSQPESARQLGNRGKLSVADMNWQSTAKKIVQALGF